MIPGIHVSVAGGLVRALETLDELRIRWGQIFTSNQRRWSGREVSEEEAESYSRRSAGIISHASYLINPASGEARVARLSERALELELRRMHRLGIEWTVLHPGAHLGSGSGQGIRRASSMVRRVLGSAPPGTGVLFENTSGQGTSLGHTFAQLAMLMEKAGMEDRTGVCLDTCHAFAAGYDISSPEGLDAAMEELERTAGAGRVKALHLNDSLGELGSGRDRHARAGSGLIGLAGLRRLAALKEFRDVPGIVETPGTDRDRAEDAEALQGSS